MPLAHAYHVAPQIAGTLLIQPCPATYASHLTIYYLQSSPQGSRRPASWRDPEGKEITQRTKEEAHKVQLDGRRVLESHGCVAAAVAVPLLAPVYA